MTINLIFKIAFLVSLAGLILVLLWVVPYIQELFQTIEQLFIV